MLFRFNLSIWRHLRCPDQFLNLPKCSAPKCYHYFAKAKFVRNMPPAAEAHVRCMEKDGVFKLVFSVGSSESATKKSMYFERNLEEPLGTLLRRICTKINDPGKKRKKDQKSDASPAAVVPVHLLRNGSSVPDEVICRDLFRDVENGDLILKIGDQEFEVLINCPWIERIQLPKVLLAGYPAYPRKYDLHFAIEDDCEFLWFKQEDRDWNKTSESIHSGYVYVPTVQDIGMHLKLLCTPKRGNVVGEAVRTISDTVVEAGPGQSFTDIRHSFTKEPLTGNSFRVVSYNILADLYASSVAGKNELFAYCPQYAMSMHYRKLLLLKELIGYNADLICLQEVDVGLFKRDLSKVLGPVGLEGVFAKKGGEVNEGAACFYNKSRLRLAENYSSVLCGEEMREKEYWKNIWESISSNEELFSFMNNLKTTIQVLVFECTENSSRKLIVANTHLYFRPDADVIRMLQAALCLQLVNHVKAMIQQREPHNTTSVIFCGDFNSTPECGVYHLFTKRHIPKDYHEWKSRKSSELIQKRIAANLGQKWRKEAVKESIIIRNIREYVLKENPNFTLMASKSTSNRVDVFTETGIPPYLNTSPKVLNHCVFAPTEFKTDGISLENGISFESACGTPEFTNFTVDFDGCIDYIFYDTNCLQVEEVLPLPSREEVSERVAIPSVVFPSDHIALVASLKWKE